MANLVNTMDLTLQKFESQIPSGGDPKVKKVIKMNGLLQNILGTALNFCRDCGNSIKAA
jgi:hypothetical protein